MNKILVENIIVPQKLYVERNADRQLSSVINDMGRPGYILVSRQMGKTNLLINAKRNLETTKDIFIYIDLSNPFPDVKSCFENIINMIIDTYGYKYPDFEEKIYKTRTKNSLPPHKQHINEIRTILNIIEGKLVVILDEIDGLVKTTYSDLFFSQIRSIYFSRVNYNELHRLTYILSGVIDPKNLIKDPTISPFNIGTKIILNDFSIEEFNHLLSLTNLNLQTSISQYIFDWTNGHPRISWDVISELENFKINNNNNTDIDTIIVDDIVNNLYLINFNTPPIDHIRELVKADSDLKDALIEINYSKKEFINDEIKNKLYLAGIINYEDKTITIKNRIIKNSLNSSWLNSIEDNNSFPKALEYINKNNFSKAYQVFLKLYRENVDDSINPMLNYYLGLCAYKSNLKQDALKYFEKIDEKFEEDHSKLYYTFLFSKASILLEIGSHLQSINEFLKIINKNRQDEIYISSVISYGAAVLHSRDKKQYNSAIKLFEKLTNDLKDDFYHHSVKDIDTIKSYAHFNLANLYLKVDSPHDIISNHYRISLQTNNLSIKPQIYLSLILSESDPEIQFDIANELVNFIIDKKITPHEYSIEEPINYSWGTVKEIIKSLVSFKENELLTQFLNLYSTNISNENLLDILDILIHNDHSICQFFIEYIRTSNNILLNNDQEFRLLRYENVINCFTITNDSINNHLIYINTLINNSNVINQFDIFILRNCINHFLENDNLQTAFQVLSLFQEQTDRIEEISKIDYIIILFDKLLLQLSLKLNPKTALKEIISWMDKYHDFNTSLLLKETTLNKIKTELIKIMNNDIKYERNDVVEYENNGNTFTTKFKIIESSFRKKEIKILKIL